MNLHQFAQNPDGTYKITCCACGKEIPHGSQVFPDESGWLCPECAEGEPRYAAASCYCDNCRNWFDIAWQVPMNAKTAVPPNRLACPQCKQRAAWPVRPIPYYGGVYIDGESDE